MVSNQHDIDVVKHTGCFQLRRQLSEEKVHADNGVGDLHTVGAKAVVVVVGLVEIAEQVELEEAVSRASEPYGNNRQEPTCLRLSFQPLKQ